LSGGIARVRGQTLADALGSTLLRDWCKLNQVASQTILPEFDSMDR